MEGKARFIFPAITAFVMAFLMTGVVTFINVGLPPDFVTRWAKAFLIAYPLAVLAAFIAVPIARKLTLRIVAALDGRKPERVS